MVRAVDAIERRGPRAHRGQLRLWRGDRRVRAVAIFWLTFACLAVTGAADTVSMVFRNLIRQLETPDRLRGRMLGVNMIFFMGGPQLGELEAGLVANRFGAVISVITGGVGCLLATAWIAARRRRCEPIVVKRRSSCSKRTTAPRDTQESRRNARQ